MGTPLMATPSGLVAVAASRALRGVLPPWDRPLVVVAALATLSASWAIRGSTLTGAMVSPPPLLPLVLVAALMLSVDRRALRGMALTGAYVPGGPGQGSRLRQQHTLRGEDWTWTERAGWKLGAC
jgi:hypothetical protein